MTDRHRGHDIEQDDGGRWVYVDTQQRVSENPHRDCGQCGRPVTAEGHDGCLGTLPGVANACCGHGQVQDAYVQYREADDE